MNAKPMSQAAKKRARIVSLFEELDRRGRSSPSEYVLGLDFSLRATGYCVLDTEGRVVEIGESETNVPDGILRERLDMHYEVFKRLLQEYAPIAVCYEAVTVARHIDSFKKLTMTQTQFYRAVSDCGMEDPFIIPVGVSTLKKMVTGSSSADKNIIIKETLKKWGVDTDSDNEADAHGAARLALYTLGQVPDFICGLRESEDGPDKFVLQWSKGKHVPKAEKTSFDAVCVVMQSKMTCADNSVWTAF